MTETQQAIAILLFIIAMVLWSAFASWLWSFFDVWAAGTFLATGGAFGLGYMLCRRLAIRRVRDLLGADAAERLHERL